VEKGLRRLLVLIKNGVTQTAAAEAGVRQ